MSITISGIIMIALFLLFGGAQPALAGSIEKPHDVYKSMIGEIEKNNWPVVYELLLKTAKPNSDRSKTDSDLLGDAIQKNDATKVRELLVKKVALNLKTFRHPVTPLRTAVIRRNKAICSLLIDHGADIKEKGLICDAVGDAEMVAFLIEQGADVRNSNCWHDHLLSGRNDQFDGAELLLKHGADVHDRDNGGRTPLHRAVSAGKTNAVRWLLDHGADVNAVDSQRKSVISLSHTGAVDIVKMLFDQGAILSPQEVPMFTEGACKSGNLVVLDFISKKGITPDYDACYTALAGQSSSNKKLLEWLMGHRMIKNGTRQGRSLFHIAAASGNLEIIRLLIRSGADVNVRVRSGKTPLHAAAAKNNLEICKLLVAAGADANAQDNSGQTALVKTIPHGFTSPYFKEMVELMVKHGADPNLKYGNDGKTLLHTVVESMDHEQTSSYLRFQIYAAEVLLVYGADIQAKDNGEGNTPLHLAVRNKNLRMIKMLVSRGADLKVRNKALGTPLHSAITGYDHYKDHELLVIGTLLSLEEAAGIKPDWANLKRMAVKSHGERIRRPVIRLLDRLSARPPGLQRYTNLAGIVAEITSDTPEVLKERMQSCDPVIALAAAETAARNPDLSEQAEMMFNISHVLFQHGRKDEAVFWFHAAQLRHRYQQCFDGNRDPLSWPIPPDEIFWGVVINNTALQDAAKLPRTVDRVLAWDAGTPNPHRVRVRSEEVGRRIDQLYSSYRDFRIRLIAEKDEMERKARLVVPEIERTFVPSLFSRCRKAEQAEASGEKF